MLLTYTIVLALLLLLNVQLLNAIKLNPDVNPATLGFFKRNLLEAYLKQSTAMGKSYYTVFYTVYSLLAVGVLLNGAWVTCLLLIAYMYINRQFFTIMRSRPGALDGGFGDGRRATDGVGSTT